MQGCEIIKGKAQQDENMEVEKRYDFQYVAKWNHF